MVAIADPDAGNLDKLVDTENRIAFGPNIGSSPFGGNSQPETPDMLKQRELQHKYGTPGSDSRSNQDSSKQNSLQQRYGNPGSDKPTAIKSQSRWRLQNWRKNRKQVFLLGAVGGPLVIGIIGILIVLIILLGLFQIPNLAANIAQYEFASLTRQVSLAADRAAEEELATEAASEGTAATGNTAANPGGTFGEEKAQFDDPAHFPRAAALFKRISSYNPAKVIENLHTDSGLTIHLKTSPLTGRLLLKDIELDGTTYSIKQATGVGRVIRWVPVFRDIAAVRDQAALYREIAPALKIALDAQDLNFVVRGITFLQFLRESNISLVAYIASKFDGLTADQSRILMAKQQYQAISGAGNANDEPTTEAEQEAKDAAVETEKDIVNNDQALLAEVKNPDSFVTKVGQVLGKFIRNDWTAKVSDFALGVVDPFYTIALPLCIIYDGSVQSSGPTMSNAVKHEEAAGSYVQTLSDQEKDAFAHGVPAKDASGQLNALAAAAATVGDTSNSIPIRRAEGLPVDTTTQISAEAGAGGGYYYDIFTALGISQDSGAWKAVSCVTSHACGLLTNTATAVAIGVVNVAGAIITFGGSEAGEEAAGQSAGAFIKAFTSAMFKNIFAKQVIAKGATVIERGLLNRLMRFVFFQGLIIGGTVGATELMKLAVISRAQLGTSGLAEGNDLVTNADAGTNLLASDAERTTIFGRDLLPSEVAARDSANAQYLAYENSQQGFTDRYFALSNPNSLIAHMANVASGMLQPSFMANFVSGGSALFAPLQSFGSLLHIFGVAYAAPDPSTQHYGNVQFGWSEDEEALIDGNYSYMPLENQKILDQSGKEDEVAQKYAACFGYDYNAGGDGNLDPTDSNSNLQLSVNGDGDIGNLLSSGRLPRDGNGNVVNDSDPSHCTPQNLGVNNPLYGYLVFRWRLAMQYYFIYGRLADFETVSS